MSYSYSDSYTFDKENTEKSLTIFTNKSEFETKLREEFSLNGIVLFHLLRLIQLIANITDSQLGELVLLYVEKHSIESMEQTKKIYTFSSNTLVEFKKAIELFKNGSMGLINNNEIAKQIHKIMENKYYQNIRKINFIDYMYEKHIQHHSGVIEQINNQASHNEYLEDGPELHYLSNDTKSPSAIDLSSVCDFPELNPRSPTSAKSDTKNKSEKFPSYRSKASFVPASRIHTKQKTTVYNIPSEKKIDISSEKDFPSLSSNNKKNK
jgi:hypothetical protein